MGNFHTSTLFFGTAPSDFKLFPALKLHLGGKHFANDDEVQAEANNWLRRQDTAWYKSGIKKLLQRYQKCLDRNDAGQNREDFWADFEAMVAMDSILLPMTSKQCQN
ncbi:hypothetical protein LAZ67_9002435 [Cordylochernes scorpioides]|uniref:Uncharacterized protein n=1 Tax=Cordylochernes scorpioides TaxID=51811 RepID=A0ABY6KVH6_9ARAC|nr:hypothetical protein LAZ67_9002435 [Cordylochernes scorpioides]